MKIKVLVIDDYKIIEGLNDRAEVTYARTVNDGIKYLLENKSLDELHLDWFIQGSGTGQDILNWLSKNLEYLPKKIYACTDNFSKANEIRSKSFTLLAMKNRQEKEKLEIVEKYKKENVC